METNHEGRHEFPEYIGTPDTHIPPCGEQLIQAGEKAVLRVNYGPGLFNMGDISQIVFQDVKNGEIISQVIFQSPHPHQIWDLPTD